MTLPVWHAEARRGASASLGCLNQRPLFRVSVRDVDRDDGQPRVGRVLESRCPGMPAHVAAGGCMCNCWGPGCRQGRALLSP